MPVSEAAGKGDLVGTLLTALSTGARRIHLTPAGDEMLLEGRVEGKLAELARVERREGEALGARLLQDAPGGRGILKGPDSPISLHFALHSCACGDGTKWVFTPLPPPEAGSPGGLDELSLNAEISAALRDCLSGSRGTLVVAGAADSGRGRTVLAMAEDLRARGRSVLSLALDGESIPGGFSLPRVAAERNVPTTAVLETIRSLDADCVVISPALLEDRPALASRIGRGGRFVLAVLDALDANDAAERLGEDVPGDLAGILAQACFPRPCSACGFKRPLLERTAARVTSLGVRVDRDESRGASLVGRGCGCDRCAGSGYEGWTHLFEFLSAPGGTPSIPLVQAAWNEVLAARLEIDDLRYVPAAPPQETGSEPGPAPEAEPRVEMPASPPPHLESRPATGDLLAAGRSVLQAIAEGLEGGEPVASGRVEKYAAALVRAAESDRSLAQSVLGGGGMRDLAEHPVRVAVLAARIGAGLGWEPDRRAELVVAALARGATRYAEGPVEAALRSALPGFPWLARVVEQVDEREDGTGGPRGLSGDAIDPLAKVVGLADSLDRLTHSRDDGEAKTTFDAIQFLMKERMESFERGIFRAMVRQISLFPVGSLVELSNGCVARVTSINPENYYRPGIELLTDAAGKPAAQRLPLDLADSPFLHITGPLRGERAAQYRDEP